MNDYERVSRVIRHLDARQQEQPELEELARHAGLSPFHFHRLFARWAAVTPKDFLQCLTATHARQLLARGETLLETAFATGLSSPGRLHDLCVSLEGASPGEIKSGGEGWEIELGLAETPFGPCCIGTGPRGICHLSFLESLDPKQAALPVAHAWPRARRRWNNAAAAAMAATLFRTPDEAARSPATNLRAFVRATPFQLRVWQALLRVPSGALVSYGTLARTVGRPGAARAVGTAVGSNPIAFLIPCHRVIRETGILGQYRWGPERKRALIGWETARGR